ncbi:MAG: hypothetical protein A2V52_06250 [Actinobacteria bacterium RBG_19FT_COMBO_54_7]|nr:MAG: hypothetical protein A2V52_06250 [Actinobacteria bacterium RBG_19FT_COMBO_54_7]
MEFKTLVGDLAHHNIHALNQLEPELKERVYSLFIPDRLFNTFNIDRGTFRNNDGERVVELIAPKRAGFATIELKESPTDRDCVFFLELADTPFFKLVITFLIVNDPRSPRFGIDLDDSGRRTKFGTARRNIAEEVRAMEAGLAPGQIRKGLGLLKDFLPRALRCLSAMGQDMLVAEPLTYHDAIIFERHGFKYIQGRRIMEKIDRSFQPGGELYSKLDGSSPFRQTGAGRTIRGRSWAIHDGVLGEPWKDIEMYRAMDRKADVCTFPDSVY